MSCLHQQSRQPIPTAPSVRSEAVLVNPTEREGEGAELGCPLAFLTHTPDRTMMSDALQIQRETANLGSVRRLLFPVIGVARAGVFPGGCGLSLESGMTSPRRGRSASHTPHRPDRKTMQLCSQVQRTLDQVLSGELDDDRLRDVYVVQVTPAPDANCLLVTVAPLGFAKDFRPDEVMARLAANSGRMRSELARAINRKKTPELMFRVVIEGDLPVPSETHADDPEADEI